MTVTDRAVRHLIEVTGFQGRPASLVRLAHDAGIAPTTFQQVAMRMRDLGLVTITKRASRVSNLPGALQYWAVTMKRKDHICGRYCIDATHTQIMEMIPCPAMPTAMSAWASPPGEYRAVHVYVAESDIKSVRKVFGSRDTASDYPNLFVYVKDIDFDRYVPSGKSRAPLSHIYADLFVTREATTPEFTDDFIRCVNEWDFGTIDGSCRRPATVLERSR